MEVLILKKFAWSYSALISFETCPRKHEALRVKKTVVEPPSEAIEWGNKVHKALELRVANGKALPPEMEQWEPIAAALLAKGGTVQTEQKLCLTSSYKPTAYFAGDAWVRGVSDVSIQKGHKLFVGDYKTGKTDPNSEQLRLSAAMELAHKPKVQEVTTAFIWLKTGEITSEKFTRDDIPGIWQGFIPRVHRMKFAFDNDQFPAKPSGLCRRWCPVTTCEHHGR